MEETTKYLIIGGGLASAWAAQNIRDRDKEGRIVLVGRENHPPYDKPPLSKQYLVDDSYTDNDAYSKADDFYANNHVQLLAGVEATKIDRANRTVNLGNGDTIRYEKLLLCTGATPRKLEIPGSDLKGILYLRTLDDAAAIRTAMQHSKRMVMVGAGYIGMEVSSGAIQRGLAVTIVEPADRPWSRIASKELGRALQSYYEQRGAKFLFGDSVTAFEGNGSLSAVRTKSGQRIEADFAVVGIGVTLNSELARNAGLEIADRGGVSVNSHLQTSDPNIWAAGDIAFFDDVASGRKWHAEHHLNAKWQGRAVGAIMAGESKPYDQVPYFFSDMLDVHMILRGDPHEGKTSTVYGDLNGMEFVELYSDDSGRLRMGLAISHEEKNLDPISDKLEELIRAHANVRDLNEKTFGLGPAAEQKAA